MRELDLFGMRIKELRMMKKLSQDRLAEAVGISSKYLSRIEMGKHFPSIATIANLASVLNVEIKDFFDFTHLTKNSRQLTKALNKLIKDADYEKLKLVYKIFMAIEK